MGKRHNLNAAVTRWYPMTQRVTDRTGTRFRGLETGRKSLYTNSARRPLPENGTCGEFLITPEKSVLPAKLSVTVRTRG